ncbi:MAG: glutaredoxin family protein [Dehalococcoidia bacterium]|nr:glutaredoxin family protein [Dehalococcoidia bacterium]
MAAKRVPGKDIGHIMLYALSTCGWCAKTRKFLEDLGVEYYYEYVDLLQGEERDQVIREVEKWNPSRSFPTLVVNGDTVIIGYRENAIRETIKV